jgi:hypothetical protein
MAAAHHGLAAIGGGLPAVLVAGSALIAFGARAGTSILPPQVGWAKRAAAGVTVALGVLEASARILGAAGRFRASALLFLLLGLAVLALFAPRRRWAREPEPPPVGDRRVVWLAAAACAVVGGVAVGLALVAARLLPVWAWDAVGYHFPFVNFLVQSGSASAVPARLAYLGTYPHNAEYLFAVLRAFLSDDRWLDACQIPFAILGAGATALIARRWDASAPAALGAGAAWLAAPAVFLQMPCGYVDVCVAAFLLLAVFWILEAPEPPAIVLAGISLGLLLGSKPSAPVPAAILCGWWIWRSAPRVRWLVPGLAAAALLGLPDFLRTYARFGNPWWPIALDLGPVHLPGPATRAELLAAGAHAARLSGPLWWRVIRSWSALRAPAAFDMRFGGLGAATVLFGFPGAFWALRSRPSAAIALLAGAAGPDPATPRFVLALPALCLALAAAAGSRVRPAVLAGLLGGVAVLGAFDLAYSAPALTGDGPPLRSYLHMTDEQRLRALGPDGSPGRWIDLRRSLAPGESIAFDRHFDLSYLLWRRDLGDRVLFVPDTSSVAGVQQTIAAEHVRFLIAGDRSPGGMLARGRGYRLLFTCTAEPCAVYDTSSPPSPSR